MVAKETSLDSARPPDPHGGRARLVPPLAGTGLLMLIYLLLRPYGDANDSQTLEAAEAFASPRWLVAHVAGALALACYGWLTVRLTDLVPGTLSRLARGLALVGLVMVLAYYGAETFALHVIGTDAVGGELATLDLVEPIRNQPVAMTFFGVGLVLLAVSAVLLALIWWRAGVGRAWSAWPLTAALVFFLPQFFLPPAARMAFGVLYAVAALVLIIGLGNTVLPREERRERR